MIHLHGNFLHMLDCWANPIEHLPLQGAPWVRQLCHHYIEKCKNKMQDFLLLANITLQLEYLFSNPFCPILNFIEDIWFPLGSLKDSIGENSAKLDNTKIVFLN